MRPIEYKVLKKIGKDGISLQGIEEIVDATNRREMKKSFPDDCHFQTTKYFAKVIANSLVRSRLVKVHGNKFVKVQAEKDKETS